MINALHMKKILIVGASSGIGLALASRLKDRYEVVSLSRHPPPPGISRHYAYDVLADKEPPELEGPLHGLVYCPGSVNLKPIRLLSHQDYKNDMEINFLGAVKVVRYYLPALMQSGDASLIFFSSVAAGVGMAMHGSISAAKAALEGWTRTLAVELAPTVRANIIAPSLVQTPLTKRLTDSETRIKVAGDRHPLKRIGQPEEISALAAFLLSDEATWITGQVFHADGGLQSLRG